MKQLKFLMIVFTLMMGVSFTSCMGERSEERRVGKEC